MSSASPAAAEAFRARDFRRLYLLQHPLAVAVSLGAVIAGAVELIVPTTFSHTALATSLPAGLEYAWLVLYLAGGALAFAGLWRLDAQLEAPGYILQAAALAVYTLTLAHTDKTLTAIFTLAVTVGLLTRGAVILRFPEVAPWSRRPS